MFTYKSKESRLWAAANAQQQTEAKQSDMESYTGIVFVALAENGTLDDVTAAEHTDLFSPWAEGIAYETGNIRSYGEELYRCVQAHTSQSNWTPDKTPALWVKIGDPAEEFPAWSQPVGAHDAYRKGDRVSYQGRHWESTVDGNVWAPGTYGWQEV